jgi:prevent-host-death family protein
MAKVGVFEAKTHLSALLDRVAAGEHVTITRHGQPIAVLVPAVEAESHVRHAAADRLRALRVGVTLGDSDLRSLIEEGRR